MNNRCVILNEKQRIKVYKNNQKIEYLVKISPALHIKKIFDIESSYQQSISPFYSYMGWFTVVAFSKKKE